MADIKEGNDTTISFFNISHKSEYDGPGIRVVIFFQSCNADCIWCHSPHSKTAASPLLFLEKNCALCKRCMEVCREGVHSFSGNKHLIEREKCKLCGRCVMSCPNSSEYKPVSTLSLPTRRMTVEELFESILPHINMVKSIGGITLSGGEALLQKKGAVELLKLCKINGINTAVETSGLLPLEYYEGLEELVDHWLYGMRFTTNYPQKDHTEEINASIKLINSYEGDILPRIPVIPGHTDNSWYLDKCFELFERYSLKKVFINPWNAHTDHYYHLSGTEEKMGEVSVEEANKSEKIIKNFFSEKQIRLINISSYY